MISPLPHKDRSWPWNMIPEPRPSDWDAGMTVCIAAHCYESKKPNEDCIICVTDTLVSTGDMSADLTVRKLQPIGKHWMVMFAGEEISYITPMLSHVRRTLRGGQEFMNNVRDAFVSAYKEQLRIKAEDEILATIGYTLEEFRKSGLQELGSDIFSRLFYEIQQQTIGVTFMVAGYVNERPIIFTVESPGTVKYYDELGFWSIGSGQTNALGSIFNSRRRVRFMNRAEAVYRVCEAKFNAENADGVGSNTALGLIYPDGSRSVLGAGAANELKPIWESTRTFIVPDPAQEKAKEILARADAEKKPVES